MHRELVFYDTITSPFTNEKVWWLFVQVLIACLGCLYISQPLLVLRIGGIVCFLSFCGVVNINFGVFDHSKVKRRLRTVTVTCRLVVMPLVGWLVLWHINLCRLFNAKSIFMKIVLFQTIQFRISMQFKCNYSLIVKNISISSYSVWSSSSNSANSV